MATTGKGAGAASAIIFGGFCLLGLVLLGIAAMIILSLISIYTPTHGTEGYGDQFSATMMGKGIFNATSQQIFNGTSVAENTALSTACTSEFQTTNTLDFAGCVMTNAAGYGTHNNSETSRRRRQARESGLYIIAKQNLYFSTTCGKKGDIGKNAASAGLSACVKKRLAACNNFINSNGAFKRWTRAPSPIPLNIYYPFTGIYVLEQIYKFFSIPFATAVSIATSLGQPSIATRNELSIGCTYVGPLSQAAIAAAIAAQATATTTLPTSTGAAG